MQLRLTAFGPVRGLEKDTGLFAPKPVLDLLVSGNGGPGLPRQRDSLDQPFRQTYLDIVDQGFGHLDLLLCTTGEQALPDRRFQRIALRRYPNAPSGQFFKDVRHNNTVRRYRKTDQAALRLNLTRRDAAAFRIAARFFPATPGQGYGPGPSGPGLLFRFAFFGLVSRKIGGVDPAQLYPGGHHHVLRFL